MTELDDDSDPKRWAGAAGLRYLRATRTVVDFVLGKLTPREALGDFASRRTGGAEAAWQPEELPDVAVDLYRSSLRDEGAPLRELEAMRAALAKDRSWKREHASQDEVAREAALAADAAEAAEVPRWFLRGDLRSFDHIHPNVEGHRLIAETACPSLPASWGCTCPEGSAGVAKVAPADGPPGLPMTTLLLLYPHWLRVLLGAPHL